LISLSSPTVYKDEDSWLYAMALTNPSWAWTVHNTLRLATSHNFSCTPKKRAQS
jgi:hypothetical protein